MSPLPALATSQVEVSERASPSLWPCVPPSRLGRGGSDDRLHGTALLPSYPSTLPGHLGEGKLLSHPTSAPPWDQGEDPDLLPRAQTFAIASRLATAALSLSPLSSGGEGEARLGARAGGEALQRVAQGE